MPAALVVPRTGRTEDGMHRDITPSRNRWPGTNTFRTLKRKSVLRQTAFKILARTVASFPSLSSGFSYPVVKQAHQVSYSGDPKLVSRQRGRPSRLSILGHTKKQLTVRSDYPGSQSVDGARLLSKARGWTTKKKAPETEITQRRIEGRGAQSAVKGRGEYPET